MCPNSLPTTAPTPALQALLARHGAEAHALRDQIEVIVVDPDRGKVVGDAEGEGGDERCKLVSHGVAEIRPSGGK